MEETCETWYHIKDVDKIDTPALVIYRDRVIHNIKLALSFVDNDVQRLRPHVKTHKTKEISKLLMDAGITKFKCATISEAEMLGMINAPDILLAYQPNGPKILRFIALVKKYTSSTFSCLIDNEANANELSKLAVTNGMVIPIFLDINAGMNRTGIMPGDNALQLYKKCQNLPGLVILGFHIYDGHIRISDYNERKSASDKAFSEVEKMITSLNDQGIQNIVVIAGGSPTFPIHAKRYKVECSPGTFVFWDRGYQLNFPEQQFLPAALVLSRIISFPTESKICLDAGHKSIAAENQLNERVFFLNAPYIQFISQSEEHLVIEKDLDQYHTGDIFYGLPIHICPTCALYERAYIIDNHEVTEEWKIIARDRKITV